MKISIITINYNNAEGLEKTILSVVSQSYKNIEYIVVDGGSEDDSKNVILKNEPYISCWVSEKDNGIYHAMNKGIKYSTGDYLLFLNSGDILMDNDVIGKMITYLDKDIVYGDLIQQISTEEEVYCDFPDKIEFSYLFEKYLPHPSLFIKLDLFKKNGYYDEKYKIVADWAFYVKAIGKCGATYRHAPLVISRYNMEGISSKPENFIKIEEERRMFLKSEFDLYYQDYVEYRNLKNKMSALKRSKIYRFFKFLGISKFE